MNWGTVIVAALQAIVAILTWVNSKKFMKAGEDAAVARATLEVLKATEEGKRLYDYIQALGDTEAESLWKRMLRDDPPA